MTARRQELEPHSCAPPPEQRRGLAVSPGLLAAGLALASVPGRASQSPAPRLSPVAVGDALQVGLGLVVVLIAIALGAWVVRRFLRLGAGGQGDLRVVSALPMGARERIVLLQVGETQLLVGVAPGRIQTLHVLEQPLPSVAGASAEGSDFSGKLANALVPHRRAGGPRE